MGEKPSFNPEQETKPAVTEIPGRSWLETDTELASQKRERTDNQDGNPSREIIKSAEGREIYVKRWDYSREQDAAGEWRDTKDVKSISESRFEHDGQGRVIKETGHHLARAHSWETVYEYDENTGEKVKSSGRITEGEKQGENWQEAVSREAKGPYTKTSKVTTGQRFENGQLVDFKTNWVEYTDGSGQMVWGWKERDGDPDTHHEWGAKPEHLDE